MLFESMSIKMHEQLIWDKLYFQVKGTFKTDNPIDMNVIFVNQALITELMKTDKSFIPSIFIDVRLKRNSDFSDFKERILGVMLNIPDNLQISRVRTIIRESLRGEISKYNDWGRLIWILLPVFFILLFFIHRFESRKFLTDISIFQHMGMTKFDFIKLSWGFVLYPLLVCITTALLIFYLFHNMVWIKIGEYNILSSLIFFTFLNWFMYMLIIFIGWWLVVYLSLINNTSASSIKEHAEFIKSVVLPEKLFSQSRNTIRRAKSALLKLIKKDFE